MNQSSSPDIIRVLLVDDDEEDYLILKHHFATMQRSQNTLEWVNSSEEAIKVIKERRHDVYLIDYRLDLKTGLDILQEVNAAERREPFILLTGMGDEAIARESLELAAADYLVKNSLTSNSLSRAIYYALGRKEQEQQKIDQLIAVNKSKDEFISIASHQLRTPATTVKQYIAMVIDGMVGSLTPKQKNFLQKAYDSNERQLMIINDLLKVAQLDAGGMELGLTPTNVSQLVRQAVEDFRPLMKKIHQKIESAIMDDIFALTDENALRMVIDNLLENAKKYSEENTTIRVKLLEVGEGLELRVADEGVGISKPDRLFEKFSRIDNKLSDVVGGTGLGLYWARSIARLHGGDLQYKPNKPVGSVFTLYLPMSVKKVTE